MPNSLYARLGGYDAIAAVADDLLPRLISDPRREKQLLVDFLCASAGGPLHSVGRDMQTSHRGMGISEGDWLLFINHVKATLYKFEVPATERAEVLAFVESTKREIADGGS